MKKTERLKRKGGKPVKRKGRRLGWLWDNIGLYLMLLVPVAYILIFHYYPMYGAQIAFRNYKVSRGIVNSDWVGLKHFINFFTRNYQVWRIIGNTVGINLYNLAAGFPLPGLLFPDIDEYEIQDPVQSPGQELPVPDSVFMTGAEPVFPGGVKAFGVHDRDVAPVSAFLFQQGFPPVDCFKTQGVIAFSPGFKQTAQFAPRFFPETGHRDHH